MRSKIFSSDYMRASSKGQIWIPAFLSLGFLMAFPVLELLMMGNWFGMNYESAQVEQLYEGLWRDGFMVTGFLVILLGGLINGINSFWYLYSSKKVDFYHSLPITRKKLFWHKTGMGILYYLIPYIVFMFMALCIGAMRGFYSLKLMGMAVRMLAAHFGLYLMVYFSTVLVICVTGNILMGFLVLGGVYVYGPMLGILLRLYTESFFTTGYYYDYGIYKFFINYCSPFSLGMSFWDAYQGKGPGIFYIVLPVVIVIFGVLAYRAYEKRKAESTGKPVIYKWLEVILKFLIVVPTGLGVGLIFYMMPEGSVRVPWWIFGMVLGTVLSHGVMEILYRMDFRGFFASRLQLAAAGAIVAFAAVGYQFDLLHFDTYIPAREQMVSLNLDLDQILVRETVPYLTEEDGKYSSVMWTDPLAAITAEKGSFDEDIYKVLSEIVQTQGKENKKESNGQLSIKYTLASGRTVYRSYQVTGEEMQKFLIACYKEGSILEKKYSFLDIEEKYLIWVSGSFQDGSSYALFQNDIAKYKELLEALQKDVQDAQPEDLVEMPCVSLNFQYEDVPGPEKDSLPGMKASNWYNADIFVYPSFKRTLAILEETGYPLSMDEVPIASVRADFYSQDREYMHTLEYTEKQEVEQIKKVLIPVNLLPAWADVDYSIDLSYTPEPGVNMVYGYIQKADMPKFMEEDKQTYESGSET